jgi:peptidoglycan lytic transglycosylase
VTTIQSRRRLVKCVCAFVLVTGCSPFTETHAPDQTASVSPQPDPSTQQRAQAIAAKVASRAKKTEKAEGRQDLVKDQVAVTTDAQGDAVVEQKGEASWYGRWHHGKKTASGTRFDAHAATAAHPTLPLGTKAHITNLENGKSVDVTITDRGPYARGRDIDLSQAAAQALGITKDGAAPVKIDAVVTPAPATSPQS